MPVSYRYAYYLWGAKYPPISITPTGGTLIDRLIANFESASVAVQIRLFHKPWLSYDQTDVPTWQ